MTSVSPRDALHESGPSEPGDLLWVEQAYHDYGKRCYALALTVVRDREFARDVVQEVFLRLFRHPSGFDPERGTLIAWLSTVTHHQAVDLVRRHHVRTRLDTGAPDRELVDRLPTPEELTCASDEQRRTRAALDCLDDNVRQLIVLAYYGGLTQREIATRLDIPLGTVKSRTLRGLKQLRVALE